jgi:hypothetical protein
MKLLILTSYHECLILITLILTVFDPSNVATGEVLIDMEEGSFKEKIPIPISDIIFTTEMILLLSKISKN